VLGLIFVKYISDTFQSKRAELTCRFADPADEYFLPGPGLRILPRHVRQRRGQARGAAAWRLAAMNLAIRGIDFNLGREPRSKPKPSPPSATPCSPA